MTFSLFDEHLDSKGINAYDFHPRIVRTNVHINISNAEKRIKWYKLWKMMFSFFYRK